MCSKQRVKYAKKTQTKSKKKHNAKMQIKTLIDSNKCWWKLRKTNLLSVFYECVILRTSASTGFDPTNKQSEVGESSGIIKTIKR